MRSAVVIAVAFVVLSCWAAEAAIAPRTVQQLPAGFDGTVIEAASGADRAVLFDVTRTCNDAPSTVAFGRRARKVPPGRTRSVDGVLAAGESVRVACSGSCPQGCEVSYRVIGVEMPATVVASLTALDRTTRDLAAIDTRLGRATAKLVGTLREIVSLLGGLRDELRNDSEGALAIDVQLVAAEVATWAGQVEELSARATELARALRRLRRALAGMARGGSPATPAVYRAVEAFHAMAAIDAPPAGWRQGRTRAAARVVDLALPCVTGGQCTAFVTSASHTGNFDDDAALAGDKDGNGLAEADRFCNQHAAAAGLRGEYVAWLSAAAPTRVDAHQRIVDAEYRNTRGETVADNLAHLLATATSPLAEPIVYDENGAYLFSQVVWTGTGALGECGSAGTGACTDTCSDWASDAPVDLALSGGSIQNGTAWTENTTASCDSSANVYCFEDETAAPSCGDVVLYYDDCGDLCGTSDCAPPGGGVCVYTDLCGVCGGDGSACMGCDGVPNSGVSWGLDCDTGEWICGGTPAEDCPVAGVIPVTASVVGGATGGSLVALNSVAGLFLQAGILRRTHWAESVAGAYEAAIDEQLSAMSVNPLHEGLATIYTVEGLDELEELE